MVKFSLILAVSFLVLSVQGRPDNYQLTQDQVTNYNTIADQWKKVINFNENPCDDFYKYTCTTTDFPNFYKLAKTEDIGDFFKNFLQSHHQEISEAEQKFVKFQETCKTINLEDTIKWMKNFNLPDTIGGWPAYTENWQPNNFHLQEAIAELTSYNHPVVFTQEFQTDNETFKNYYLISKENVYDVNSNKEWLQERLTKYGVINPQEIIQDGLQYQKVYDEAVASVQSASDIKVTFTEFKKLFPEINWDYQISHIYGGPMAGDFPVLIKSEKEVQAAWTAISKLSPKIISNYFFIKFITFEDTVNYDQYVKLFQPVLSGALKKYILTEPLKQEIEGMITSTLGVFQEVFKIFGTGDAEKQIYKFVNEEILNIISDQKLNKEYEDIALVTTPGECLTNFHYLQHLFKIREAKWHFTENYEKITKLQKEINQILLNEIPKYSTLPSPFLFNTFILKMVASATFWWRLPLGFTTAQKQCYTHQLNKEITDNELTFILMNQVFTKAYFKWINDYPDVVEVENNLFKQYDLSSQKLLTIWFAKYVCNDPKTNTMTLSIYWNLPEFATYFQCPTGTKMNPTEKCTLW